MPGRPYPSQTYDVAIVGAGPAGSAAAYHAARGGLRVLIVDRNAFPRAKTCGDALIPRAVAAVVRMGVGTLPGHTIYGARFLHTLSPQENYEDFRAGPWPEYGLVINRAVLDHALLERARAVGAEFRVGTVRRVIAARSGKAHQVMLETLEGAHEIRAGVVIAATGATSPRFLAAPIQRPPGRLWAVAGRTYLRVSRDPGRDLEFYFPLKFNGRIVSGYGWVFPAGTDVVNIGVGLIPMSTTQRMSVRRLIEGFIHWRIGCDERLKGATPCDKISTAPLALAPVADCPRGVLTVGDLAGLANPLTGEGITSALESGELAARAVLSGDPDTTLCYQRLLAKRFRRNIRQMPIVGPGCERPEFMLGRGGDLLLRPTRRVGSLVRRILWDQPTPHSWWSDLRNHEVRESVECVREELIDAAWRIRSLFGGMIAEITEAPETRFGRYAAFGAAVRAGVLPQDGISPPRALDGFLILEIWNLVASLHEDLLSSAFVGGSEGDWGCDTLALVLADGLNAVAMRRMCQLDAEWISKLALTARELMGRAAAAAMRGLGGSSIAEPVQMDLYLTAARLALSYPPTAPLAPLIVCSASYLAKQRSAHPESSLVDGEVRRALAGTRDPLAGAIRDVITAMGASSECATPVEYPRVIPGSVVGAGMTTAT